MLQKIQALQKRLILKTEEVVEKDLLIQEKEKLYVELKNILARHASITRRSEESSWSERGDTRRRR